MNKLNLIIGNKNYSSWSLRPWILMKQFNIDFDETRVALYTDTTTEKLNHYQSNHKVPILLDGDLQIWDSLAILEYVSEKYLQSKAWPVDSESRAVARSISAEMHSGFSHIRNEMPMNCKAAYANFKISAEVSKEIKRIALIWQSCRQKYTQTGDWLFGQYSIADAMFAPVVLRFNSYGVKLEGQAQQYVSRVLAQQYIQQWISEGIKEKEIIAAAEITQK
jgi:glutathione S-transferase